MAYNNTTPQPPDVLSQSQVEFRDNFEQLDTAINVNHVGFNNGADSGKHNLCTFPTGIPFDRPLINEIKLQGFLNPQTNLPELVYQYGPPHLVGLNNLTTRRFPLPQQGASWAYLGGSGLLMKWGYAEFIGLGQVDFPDDNNLSVPRFGAAPFNIQVSPISIEAADTNTAVRTVAKTNRNFTVFCSTRTLIGATEVPFFYVAIGAV